MLCGLNSKIFFTMGCFFRSRQVDKPLSQCSTFIPILMALFLFAFLNACIRKARPTYLRKSAVTLPLATLLSSTTCNRFGHSGQLCTQQTITSQPFGSCLCSRKLRLSNSNSIRTSCHLPSGYLAYWPRNPETLFVSDGRRTPAAGASMPNANTTPDSFTGSCTISGIASGFLP